MTRQDNNRFDIHGKFRQLFQEVSKTKTLDSMTSWRAVEITTSGKSQSILAPTVSGPLIYLTTGTWLLNSLTL